MRVFELRLEDIGYEWTDERATPYISSATVPDSARAFAALEFFDRAYLRALGGIAARPDGDFRIAIATAFALARDATLLRFGVRIVPPDYSTDERLT